VLTFFDHQPNKYALQWTKQLLWWGPNKILATWDASRILWLGQKDPGSPFSKIPKELVLLLQQAILQTRFAGN